MPLRLAGLALLVLGLWATPWALACTLCQSLQDRQTLRLECQRAKLVLLGTAANPQLNMAQGATPGSGTTELHVTQVIKAHEAVAGKKIVILDRYIPVVNPKSPPKFLVFFNILDGKLDPYSGRPIASGDFLPYLERALRFGPEDKIPSLAYFFQFIDHQDPEIAADAFLELAKSSDADLAQLARKVPTKKIEQLLNNPQTPTERIGLLAFLLGAGGDPKQAAFLEKLIDNPTPRLRGSLDGLLCGLIQIKPREGWQKTLGLLGDVKKPFADRFAAARVLKFYQNLGADLYKEPITAGLRLMLQDPELADLAIEDSRRWKSWHLSREIVPLYQNPKFSAPITRRAILRFALVCPQPEMRAFLDAVRQTDREILQEVEEVLKLENQLATK